MFNVITAAQIDGACYTVLLNICWFLVYVDCDKAFITLITFILYVLFIGRHFYVLDSITSSLISGITSMPSHLDIEGEVDGLEEEDFEPSVTPSQASLLSRIPAVEYSSDSDESEHRNIEFKSSHFNPDSSSEEESSYTKGLNFSEVKEEGAEGSSLGGILSNLGSIGSTLVSNVMKTAVSKESPKKQDSDSDFEIINNEELDEQ